MDSKTALCKDCKHFQYITTLQECTRKVVHSPIDGTQSWPLCRDERSPITGTCGPDGLHWVSLTSTSKSIEQDRRWDDYNALLSAAIKKDYPFVMTQAREMWLFDAIQHVYRQCTPEVQKKLIDEEKKNG